MHTETVPRASTAAELARLTPPSRDRYMDFLRAVSIGTVVVGHWFIADIYWQRGVIGSTSAIGVAPWLWLGTWVAQVMPLFFFVGGFANYTAYRSYRRRGEPASAFLRTRLARLLRPSLAFFAVWGTVQVFLHLANMGTPTTPFLRGMKPPGATIPFGPLWFLAMYTLVILIAPAMIRLHRRFGIAVPIVMVAGSVVSDALGFAGGIPEARWANAAFVWLLPHQLGFFYAEGRLQRLGRRAFAAMAAGGLAALVLLTNPVFGEAGQRWFPGIGHYPKSLLGTEAEAIANTYPPTICLLAAGFWLIGAAMLLREPATRWLRRERPWRRVVAVNGVIMTLFLWHMTAFLIAVVALWPLGLGHADPPGATWWIERPLWLGVPALILLSLIRAFARFERPAATRARAARGGPGRSRSA
ncbi:MAG TPA: acyltransferase [Actinomycetota bacterium]|nr:acyltransferase [Actinomycetota bacterium]